MKLLRKRNSPFDFLLERTCLTCENKFQGKYCGRCGEKVVEPYDRSFKNFIDNLLNAFTFIDGKFFNSLKTILLHPGKMSSDIAIGRRQPYMKPVAFFFVGNFIYFFVPVFETFNNSLYSQLNFMPYSDLIEPYVQEHLKASALEYNIFEEKYNASSTNWAKTLLVLLAPIAFPFLLLVNYSRRSYLSDHFIYALEFVSFFVFVPTILLSFLVLSIIVISEMLGFNLNFLFHDRSTTIMVLFLTGYFFLFSHRNFYQFSWWRSCLSTALLLSSLILIIHIYRFVLFAVTMWSLK